MAVTATTGKVPLQERAFDVHRTVALGLALAGILLWIVSGKIRSIASLPSDWTISLAAPLGAFLNYITHELSVGPFTISQMSRALAEVVAAPMNILQGLLASGLDLGVLGVWPPLPWPVIGAALISACVLLRSPMLAVFAAIIVVYLVLTGLWQSAMLTLSSVLFSTAAATALGVLAGVTAYRHPRVRPVLESVYDTLQTVPVFSYLVLILLLFGLSPVSAVIATLIYALPPIARATDVGLRTLSNDLRDLAEVSGCTSRQSLFLVELPAARATLLVGLNQTVLMALAMVIVGSLIGAGGLGADVLRALKAMRFGQGLQAGMAITLMAVLFDRMLRRLLISPAAQTKPDRTVKFALLLLVGVAIMTSLISPAINAVPNDAVLGRGQFLDRSLVAFNVSAGPTLAAMRDFIISYFLRPARTAFSALPWLPLMLLVGAAITAISNWRAALLPMGLLAAISLLGLWGQAMLSLYLVAVSVAVALIIGVPIGIAVASNDRLFSAAEAVVDTIQTLPSFVYLVPIAILFGVGDFPAFLAITVYVIAPVVRYTATALRDVPLSLREVGEMAGCNRLQSLLLIEVPVAMPRLLLGLNQSIMLGFAMLVITALVGSRGLEQTTLVAIAQVKPGDGLIAGLGIAALAIVCDRFCRAAAASFVNGRTSRS